MLRANRDDSRTAALHVGTGGRDHPAFARFRGIPPGRFLSPGSPSPDLASFIRLSSFQIDEMEFRARVAVRATLDRDVIPEGVCAMQASRLLLPMLILGSVPWAGDVRADDRAANEKTTLEAAAIAADPALTLHDLFRLAELSSPALASARAGVQAHAGRVRHAGLYPNPELTLAVEEMSVEDPDFRKQKVELMQPLLIGGRRGAAVEAARASLAAADHQAEQIRRGTLLAIHGLWVDLMHVRETRDALDELLVVAESSLEVARTRYEARAAPEAHVTRAMLEVYELQVMLQDRAQEEARSLAELDAVLGGPGITADRLEGDLEPDHEIGHLTTAPDSLLAEHPLVRAAGMEVAAARAELRSAEAARIPDLNVFVAYGSFEADEGNFVEGGLSFPLPIFNRNQGRVDETRALVVQAEFEARRVENELAVALSVAKARHHMAHEQLDMIAADIAPAAARGLEQAREAYRVGRMMFLELVDAQRTYTDVRLRTLELRRNLALAEADLMCLLGEGPYVDPGVER